MAQNGIFVQIIQTTEMAITWTINRCPNGISHKQPHRMNIILDKQKKHLLNFTLEIPWIKRLLSGHACTWLVCGEHAWKKKEMSLNQGIHLKYEQKINFFISCESVIRASGQCNKVALEYRNSYPFIFLVSYIEVTRAFEY